MAKETKKNKNIASFTEEDSASLVEKYDAITLLTLLQEMANYPDSKKFDWNKLVSETSTGISNAREYQMLWRHMAHGHAIEENLDENAQPLDDDSDIECERKEPSSIAEQTALLEVEACVKVMTDSHKLNESAPTSSKIEAPMTISVPISGSSSDATPNSNSDDLKQEKKISFGVTIPRVRVGPYRRSKEEGGSMSSSSSNGSRGIMKGKHWSEEEDKLLLDSIDKWGEGNWAYMVRREDFPLHKTSAQLAKRWSTLRKKQGNNNSGSSSSNSSQSKEE